MKLDRLSRGWKASIGGALARIRYRSRPDPYRAFRSLDGWADPKDVPTTKNATVLVVPVRVSSTSNLLEGVIGAGLRLDGYRVLALLDGGTLKYSENSTFGKSRTIADALSVYEQQQFCATFGIEPRYFSELIDEAEFEEIKRKLNSLGYDQLVRYKLQGVAIGFHARSGLMRYLRQETIDIPENAELLREFVKTGVATALAVKSVVIREKVTHALLSHGTYSTWGVACEVLVSLGVTVSVWGRGYVGGNLMFGRNQSYLSEEISTTAEDVVELSRDRTGGLDIDEYFRAKARPRSGVDVESYYDDKELGAPLETAKQFDAMLEGAAGVIGIFPNIPWDGTAFSASTYTPSLRAFAHEIQLAAQRFPKLKFIVRIHPAETVRKGNITRESFASFFSEEALGAAPNVKIIPSSSSITSYDLMERCGAAVVFGTTLAMEMAFRGLPVLLTGKHRLSNKGVVFEISDRAALDLRLREVMEGKLRVTEVMKDNMRRYAHYHVNLEHIADDMMATGHYSFEKYKFSSVDDLRQGRLKTADAIKSFVLGQTNKCLNPYA
ncbi:hypothetical protein [Hyphomicrobium sp.]|uniref:hypothetical protein n=1 Tax=Hyphomicrobium sp. TaxID=82 RepID=UPI003F6FAE8A